MISEASVVVVADVVVDVVASASANVVTVVVVVDEVAGTGHPKCPRKP